MAPVPGRDVVSVEPALLVVVMTAPPSRPPAPEPEDSLAVAVPLITVAVTVCVPD